MPGRTRLYHPTRAPEGQDFETDGLSLKAYETQGWVDDPAKAGTNPWGKDAAPEVISRHIRYREGRIRGIASGQDTGNGVRCAIWNTIALDVTPDSCELLILESPRAGGAYGISRGAANLLRNKDDPFKARLTSILIDQRRLGSETPEVTEQLIEEAKHTMSCTVQQRADRLLQYIDRETTNVGDVFALTDQSVSCGAIAWSESTSLNEVSFLLEHLTERDWIRESYGKADSWVLSVSGYARVSELLQKRVNSSDAFVAMWFDESMDMVWEQGIKPGIQDAGYRPVRIDGTEHNDKIDDRIVAQIRRSRFLVADFTQGTTGARGGVYYEAGFAHGLSLPVIFTCRKDLIEAVHFDTRQYNHITWENTVELRSRLSNRIAATIGDGPIRSN